MNGGQYEIVLYRLKPAADRGRFLRLSAQATDWLRQCTGYLGRELLEDDGQWVDVVRWATMHDALAAGEAFVQTPIASEFMAAVEPESVQMLHPMRVVSYE